MDKKTGFTWTDFFSYSSVGILFGLAALLIPLLIVGLCLWIYVMIGGGG